jgi:hypothetical protein
MRQRVGDFSYVCMFLSQFGTVLGRFWDHFGTDLGEFGEGFGTGPSEAPAPSKIIAPTPTSPIIPQKRHLHMPIPEP